MVNKFGATTHTRVGFAKRMESLKFALLIQRQSNGGKGGNIQDSTNQG